MKKTLSPAADRVFLEPDILRPLSWEELFRNPEQVILDLGAGDGGFTLAYARQRPAAGVLAVERLLGRARKIARRAARPGEETPNVRVLRLESAYVLERLCPPASVDEIHLLFPDPWPKRRHHERRTLQLPFLAAAARVLKPGGLFRFVTDDPPYAEHGREVCAAAPGYAPGASDWDFPQTDFEAAFRAEGKPIHTVLLRKA
ncbi:MAG: tRNA (guanosine(46)-N7)-methyltransferase TrmB [Verrucomicrobium sp.]|nr:tRNA (guanosine(46)-N7)-methyltransferase TrmB [Verrucomicrobium sp.]